MGKPTGKRKHPLYTTWSGMKQRCYNPKSPSYCNYGERGIKVCERWLNDFWAFVEDMGTKPSPSHSIERKDNHKGYEPSNCCWATPKEQADNRRKLAGAKAITFKGQTKTLSDWAAEIGISVSGLHRRIYRSEWSIECALTTPPYRDPWYQDRQHGLYYRNHEKG